MGAWDINIDGDAGDDTCTFRPATMASWHGNEGQFNLMRLYSRSTFSANGSNFNRETVDHSIVFYEDICGGCV
ncbi:hypothetical protein BG842_03185 [Haladaptatus sp. W1]|nr:hypothetical protein BG842_22845 [Haladaptatus sp. W1]ODR80074.1 hypothetical protein BG842_03185 [Haladaptatus sp. W1]